MHEILNTPSVLHPLLGAIASVTQASLLYYLRKTLDLCKVLDRNYTQCKKLDLQICLQMFCFTNSFGNKPKRALLSGFKT